MSEALPTLKGLRAFEEAYLLGSYTAAAERLNVQQPAISYQIKRLEEDLGLTLFEKKSGRLVPTSAADELYASVSTAFDAIRYTSNQLRQTAKAPSFTIATYPGIGTYWLSSRLQSLTEALDMPVKIITLVKDADLLKEPADCLILFGKGAWPGREARLLMQDAVCPVAAPELAEKVKSNTGPRPSVTIIDQPDSENRWISWKDWAAQSSDDLDVTAKHLVVNDHGFALHLALSGAGITLAWLGVIESLLAGGSLVRLSEKIATSDAGYYIVGNPGFLDGKTGQTLCNVLGAGEIVRP